MKRNKGFTLIELLVTVVIIGVLAAIALPVYEQYVLRGKIPEATSTLSDLRVRMEQYYQDNRTYQNVAGTGCGVAMPAGSNFTFTCPNSSAATYTIQADGIRSMAGFRYTINEQNAKTSTITARGWTGNATCWATKSNGSC